MVQVITWLPPRFDQYLIGTPGGWLPRDQAAHALFHYYVTARRSWELFSSGLVRDDAADHKFNPRTLFTTIAKVHNVEPERMERHWGAVNMQATMLKLPHLPAVYQYGAKPTAIITSNTQH